MRLTKGALITLLAALAASVATSSIAQTDNKPRSQEAPPGIVDCPTVYVSCPDTGVFKQPVTFTADISGGDPDVTPIYKWKVSAGKITRGEGTGSITVDISNAVGQSVSATVEIVGYEPLCMMEAVCKVSLGDPPVSRKVGEYGDIKLKDEWARLDKFAAELGNELTAQGFFVCYGGRRSAAGEAQRRCDRAMRYTSARFSWADPTRLVTVDAGYRCEPLVELWVVPSGAEPPADAPLTTPEPRPSAAKCRPPRGRARR